MHGVCPLTSANVGGSFGQIGPGGCAVYAIQYSASDRIWKSYPFPPKAPLELETAQIQVGELMLLVPKFRFRFVLA